MYSSRSLVLALVSSLLNALGAWALLAAMKSGGRPRSSCHLPRFILW